MSEAIRLIVGGYVHLKDREALVALREHRQRLKRDLIQQPHRWLDISRTIQQFDEDILTIEEGLQTLDGGSPNAS